MVAVRTVLDRLEKVRRSGDGWSARCPAHDDSDPSLSVAEGRDGRVLLHCFAGCSAEVVAGALGLDLSADLGPEDGGGSGYTLADYADEKNLPAAELRRWGVRTAEREKGSAVAIPYRDARGETDGVKIRAGDRFWWDEHSGLPYGLDRLEDADPDRSVLLVEGESDCHACWHHDVLALGVPGADSWRSDWTRLLDGREVYVWREPDEGGEGFATAVTADLPDARVIEAPEDAEDPAELHRRDPDAFRERLRALTAEAASAELDGLDLTDAAVLLAEPEKLRRPEAVVPRVVFRRSVSLVSGRPNVSGKTSLLVAAGAEVAAGGRFFGEFVPRGTVLWVMAEGAKRHIGRYLAQVEAAPPPGRFQILRSGTAPLAELERAVSGLRPDLVVIDSLGTWLAPLDVDLYTEEVVGPLRRVERVARSGPGVALIHHPRKADDDPAGSHKIVAVADLVRSIEEGGHERERVMKGNGRWRLPELRWRLEVTGDHPEVPDLETVRFHVVDPERELEERILDFLTAEPGASKSAVRAKVEGARASAIDDALQQLVEDGIVLRDKSGRAHTHRIRENPPGHGTDTVRTRSGHGRRVRGDDDVSARVPPTPFREGGPTDTVTPAPGPGHLSDGEGGAADVGSGEYDSSDADDGVRGDPSDDDEKVIE